jgi:hypothetical protein
MPDRDFLPCVRYDKYEFAIDIFQFFQTSA